LLSAAGISQGQIRRLVTTADKLEIAVEGKAVHSKPKLRNHFNAAPRRYVNYVEGKRP
jgi:hypothetical protein